MDDELIKRIYRNVIANAQRYWDRTSLFRNLYHDAALCNAANSADNHIAHAYSNTREALVDSSIVSLTRGFLDSGNDSLSLTRLIPSSNNHLISKDGSYRRRHEEDNAFQILYERWYGEEENVDGNFVRVWYELEAMMKAFRASGRVQRIISFRNNMVAHNLTLEMEEPPEFTMLYDVRNDIIPIMNKLTGVIEGTANSWETMLYDSDRAANGYSRILTDGFAAQDS